MFVRLATLVAITLVVGCVRPPTIDGASCPCPQGYHCEVNQCVPGPAPITPDAAAAVDAMASIPPRPTTGACPPGGGDGLLPRRLVRLTPVQLATAIADLTGYQVSPQELSTDEDHARAPAVRIESDAFARAPSAETTLVLADIARRAATAMVIPAACTGNTAAPACFAFLVERMARASHRQPGDSGVIDLDGTFRNDAASIGAESAVRAAIEMLIQAPQFVYRSELGTLGAGNTVTLAPEELAAALSFVLTDGPPDDTLFNLWEQLQYAPTRRAQAVRLRETAAGRAKTLRFLNAFADVDRLGVAPPEALPSQVLADDMLLETGTFLAHVYDQGGALGDLFGAPYTFVTPTLSGHYGVAFPPSMTGAVMMSIPGRTGLLNQGSFLVAHAPGPGGLPAYRGVTVASQLFCQEIPVDPSDLLPQAPGPDLPVRDRYPDLITGAICQTCHTVFDPLGLGLENFDRLGRHRDSQGGKAIDTSIGDYSPQNLTGPFSDTVELARKAVGTPAGQACFTRQYLTFVLGEQPDCGNSEVESAFQAAGARVPALLDATAASAAFVTRRVR